eukprot:1450841-Prymnesium_polylepis.2
MVEELETLGKGGRQRVARQLREGARVRSQRLHQPGVDAHESAHHVAQLGVVALQRVDREAKRLHE